MVTPRPSRRRTHAISLRGRRGFSLAEVITVLAVVGILAGISILRLNPAKEAAQTAVVTSDLRTIALAAQTFQMEHGRWPASGGDGGVPPDLVNYLPGGFSFRGPGYSYEYRNVDVDGQPAVSISVRATNPTLRERLEAAFAGRDGFMSSGGVLSYTVSGSIQMGVPESGTIAAPTK